MNRVGRLDQAFEHFRAGLDRACKAKLALVVEDHDGREGFDVDAGQIVFMVFDVDPVPNMSGLFGGHLLEQGFIASANDAPLCAQAGNVQGVAG